MWSGFLVVLTSIVTSIVGQASQRFTETPSNRSVIQGTTVVLNCSVANRKGAVQWSKNGFFFGFNRTIPGFDRYSMVSSHADQFNLMIINTQLIDDALYACQVLPGGGDARLQAKATLTILVPCEAPRIVGYENGSIVEVPHTQNSLSLTCESKLGRPAATIKWFRDGVEVTNNIRTSVESVSSDKRQTARSTITIPLANHGQENGKTYQCQATNSAILGPPMKTSVQLNILYPPGAPEISGYSNNRVIKVNDTLILTCKSRGGNPLGTVTWYRNNEPKDRSFHSDQNQSSNEYTFRVKASDNKAVYRCEVTSLVLQEPLIANYTLTVHFPPTSVVMTGAREPVRAGRQVSLTCVTSNSNPKATVVWFAKHRQLSSSEVRNTYSESPNGGQITTSRVSVTVGHQDHNNVYTCQATNSEFGETVSDRTTLSVLYPPNRPEIRGYEAGSSVRAGDVERMTCISVGGNPVANLKWYKGSRLIRKADYKTIGTIAHSEIAVVVEADDNGATYTCKASNRATSSPLEVSVTLTVDFPPSHVFITASPSLIRAGQQIDLTCVCSSSNPPAQITWVRNGRRLSGTDLGSVAAENGGRNTTNRLRFRPTAKDNNAIFGCRATNPKLDQSVNDAMTLKVLFKPEFDVETLPSKVTVKKGERASLNLTANANPAVSSYRLFKNGATFSLPSRFRLSGGLLNISNVAKGDEAVYSIKATNTHGDAMFNFTIQVKYPAEIVDITNRLTKNEGDTATFMCKVDANPIVPDIATWTRANFDMSRTQQRTEGNTTFLTVYDLSREDAGTFKCVADNNIGNPVTRTSKLIVKFTPIIDKSVEMSRSAGEKGTTVSLKCKAKGAPEVTFTWTRNNEIISGGSKYSLSNRKSGINFESNLRIKRLNQSDYGSYICTASNSKGSDSHSVTVSGTSKPYPPESIELVNATASTLTISWRPGFNGGLPQSFRVRYKPTEARGYAYKDVSPYGATRFKLKGLELDTDYEVTVLAFNEKGESSYHAKGIVASTADKLSQLDVSNPELQGADEIPVIIILVVCIVGVFILTLNVGLILFFIRKRKKRLENGTSDTTSHTNTFELYGNTQKGDHSAYPPPSDDTRSYGTYDKSMDDFSDDYGRDFDKDYCRPYSPQKIIESPRMGHKTFIRDDISAGRISPWNEDPYRVSIPRQKRGIQENGGPNGEIYHYNSRGQGMNELSDRPPSRPSSRSGKTPPPPPTRSSSRGADYLPPIPSRNYSPHEVTSSPRYGPLPGSSAVLSPNIIANHNYNGPIRTRTPSPNDTLPAGSELRGHLV